LSLRLFELGFCLALLGSSRTHVTRSRESMRRAPGLVLLFLCICALSFHVKRTLHYASNSNPRANHTDSEVDTQILGEYRTFRAGLGLQEAPSTLRLSTSFHSFYAHASPLLTDNAIPLPRPRRIETSSLTSGLDDEPENHSHSIRKMLRRSSTFGLELSTHSHRRRRGESRNMPAHAHPKLSEIGGGDGGPPSLSLHFAVDSIREPRTSSEQFLREYALLSANLDNVGATSFTKGGSSNAKPKTSTSPKGKSASANRASARPGSGRRSRGRRRPPSHVEH